MLRRGHAAGPVGRAAGASALVALSLAALRPALAPSPAWAAPRPAVRLRPPSARPSTRRRQDCADPTPHGGPIRSATVSLGSDSEAQVVLDPQVGRVTLCIFDRATGEPEHLRADVLSLYLTPRSALDGSRPIHIWLDPLETEHDAVGLPRASRFSGESAQLRGLGSADGLLSQVIVRGIPFWGVAVHLGATPGARGR
jgi:hypothetical protein